MKLLSKLTLFTTLSKLVIMLLFILALPYLVDFVAFHHSTEQLKEQEEKVFNNIRRNGLDYYLDGDSSYGSYSMLKEEYISLGTWEPEFLPDTLITAQRVIEGDTMNYRVLSHTFEYEGRNYNLEVGRSLASIDQYNRPLQRIALYVLAVLIGLTLIADLGFTRILLRPLQTIIRTKLLDNQFPFKPQLTPVHTSTTDFRYLDESLIALMNRIKADFDREREFTSNASHELMTPIGILQSKMENLLIASEGQEDLQARLMDQLTILSRLKKIVNSLLLISRIDNDQYHKRDKINPEKIVNDVVEELQHRITQREILMAIDLHSDVMITNVNQNLIFQMLHNLVNNAVRYNKDGGSIFITDEKTTHGYRLMISDSGIGIEADELPGIFDRFRKTGESSPEGYGLGLSIVRSIADYHGIVVEVESVVEIGTKFSLLFPAPSRS